MLFVWKNRQNRYQLRVKKKTKGASRIARRETQSTMGEVDQRQTAAKPHQRLVISLAKKYMTIPVRKPNSAEGNRALKSDLPNRRRESPMRYFPRKGCSQFLVKSPCRYSRPDTE